MNLKLVIALATLPLIGCTSGYGTGANLSVDYFGDSDVVGYAFEISESSEEGCTLTGQGIDDDVFFVNLLDGIFPGRVAHVEKWFENDTRHLGADMFTSLQPGCYDIAATPLKAVPASVADWDAKPADYVSTNCSNTSDAGINVVAGKTSEIALASQCVGDGAGAVDATIILNHPPTLTLTIDEKYNYECEKVEVCATAFDVDDDPIDIDWTRIVGSGKHGFIEGTMIVTDVQEGHRVWKQCVDVWTQVTASHKFTATVYDLAEDGKHIEDLLEDWGVAEDDAVSHFTFEFPIHTNWVEYPMCFDGDGDLVDADGVDIDLMPEATCKPTSAEAYYCDKDNKYKVSADLRKFICKGTDLIEENLYPECD